MKLSPTEILRDKKIFFIGGTGFVGKVTLSMLLHNFPDVGKVYTTVRARDENESQTRFWTSIVTSPTFDPLREKYGDGFEAFIREKVVPVNGDVGNEFLGMDEAEATRIMQDCDLIINGAGNVTFNPPLESALRTNINGSYNIIKLARMMKKPRLVHVSTCFVAGKRSGSVWESEPVVGYFPRKNELVGTTFDVFKEIEDCARLSEQARQEADDAVQQAKFREQARKRFMDEGRDPDDEGELKSAIFRERKMWIRERTTELGAERAEYWGWTNIYTYSKSLAEQIIASQDDIVKTLVRPSIVESSNKYPFPGWNEGFTTTAPLILISLRGQPVIPVNEKLILDVIPVDMVSGVIIAAAVKTLVDDNPPLVFQSSSGDSNPNDMKRIVGLVGLYKRRHFQEKETGNKLVNAVTGMIEATPVSQKFYERTSAPMLNKLAKSAGGFLERAKPTWAGGKLSNIVSDLKKSVDDLEHSTAETMNAFAMFKPFMIDNAYLYRSDNVRDLIGSIKDKEKDLLPWYPEKLDWYEYWMNVHFPGMKKWVLPTLEEELKAPEKRGHTYKDLIDLFETTTKRFGSRIAFKMDRDGKREQYAYPEVRELAIRAAGALAEKGIEPGDKVLLASPNQPEWGISYFAILKSGAVVVPVSPFLSAEEMQKIVELADAKAVVCPDFIGSLLAGSPAFKADVIDFNSLFEMHDEAEEGRRTELLPAKVAANATAVITFTSGTTGEPRPVALTHKNLVNMVSMLSSVLEIDTNDGVLSVLPLYHVFECSAGFLTPFANGTKITYVDGVSSEELASAIENGHVTGMVGVPALWEVVHNRVKSRLRRRGEWIADAADSLIDFNAWVRDNTPLNLGPILFLPIHQRMGGRMRYLISGGSSLSEKVKKDLHGLGFTVLEGYGMAESSPVLTVARPGDKYKRGSVGKPLPGIDIKIENADENGFGEVFARGQSVMQGYFNDDESTAEAVTDRWLNTGDIGKLDEDGDLILAGRMSDMIVDDTGRRVFPNELEEIYANSQFIAELNISGVDITKKEKKIAALVVPDLANNSGSPQEIKAAIETHFRQASAKLPLYKRVKSLHFYDRPLPRTSNGKIKRQEVKAILQQMEASDREKTAQAIKAGGKEDMAWLAEIVSHVASVPAKDIKTGSKLKELGFDSIMFVEFQAAVEDADGSIVSVDGLSELETVGELMTVVHRDAAAPVDVEPTENADDLDIPEVLKNAGNWLLVQAEEQLFSRVLDTKIEGQINIPPHVNFIIAPNHASHLDTGLVKKALGKDVAEQTFAIAAADYWFDTKYKRALMNNFTSILPIERSGSLRNSLNNVGRILDEGYNALIFPEGTRSADGVIGEFKSTIGYLAMKQKVGILPVYIWGTAEAYPKGVSIPDADLYGAKVGVKIGKFIEYEELVEIAAGLSNVEGYRAIAKRIRDEVVKLGKTRTDAAAS